MIQRIQSVYLLLTTLLAVLFLTGDIINFENGLSLRLEGIEGNIQGSLKGESNIFWPFSVILIIVPSVSFLTIFTFRNRKLQMKMTIVLILFILLEIAAAVYFTHYTMGNFNTHLIPGIKIILPLLMLVTAILAYRGIRKDENLVRSYDRLR